MSFLVKVVPLLVSGFQLSEERRLPPLNCLSLSSFLFFFPAHPFYLCLISQVIIQQINLKRILDFKSINENFAVQMLIRAVPYRSKILSLFLLFSVYFPFRCASTGKEQTLGIIKPDGLLSNYTDKIKNVILDSGFVIRNEVSLQLDEDSVRTFYAEHSSMSFFNSLITYMTSGPVLVMILEKENAVADWRALIGPTDARKAKITHPHSIRAMCGTNSEKNCVHGSDSPQSAQREISFFFKEKSAGTGFTEHEEL